MSKSNWIFLSQSGQDEYINMFAQGCGTQPTNTDCFDYDRSQDPIVLRGILKHKIMKRCWQDSRDFYYMDTGYFGNARWKKWHRIVKNNLQHENIVPRPDDRFRQFNRTFAPWKKSGRNILIATPDEKPCKFYGIELEQWIETTVATIKQHTDRPVVVRRRSPNRIDRAVNNTLQSALSNDVFALVTYNSVAAVESVFYGVPVFTLAPVNAASPVSRQDLSMIEKPYYVDQDKLYAWACHLAYGQFHISELQNGTAQEILKS
jgi:hypothetical protein